LAFSPDGTLFAAGTTDGRILLWDPRTFAEPDVIEAERGLEPPPAPLDQIDDPGIRALAFDPERGLLAAGSRCHDGEMAFLDAGDGNQGASCLLPKDRMNRLGSARSPDIKGRVSKDSPCLRRESQVRPHAALLPPAWLLSSLFLLMDFRFIHGHRRTLEPPRE